MKKLWLLEVLLFTWLMIIPGYVRACFRIGADISWTCVGQDSFLIKLNVYTDCNGMSLSSSPITFKCASTGVTITTLTIGVGTPIDITPVCQSSCTRCQSASCTFPYGIRKYSMQKIVSLNNAGSCCNINMSWEQCCRQSMITTGSADANFFCDAKLNRCLNPCDNSPSFTNNPIIILCKGQDFTFNHGAVDSDTSGGLFDSLTYQWTAPLQAAGSAIPYIGSFSYDKPITFDGFPNAALAFPKGFHLNSQTGDIQFRPTKVEVTVMVLQVNEFRNGVKIGEIRRDLTIHVINCASNTPPLVSTPNNVKTKHVCPGDTLTFNFSTSDANASDTVTLNWNNAIPGAIWTTTNGQTKRPTATLTWVPTTSEISARPYSFTVTARDNACPLTAQFTQNYQILVSPIPDNITISDSGCGDYFFRASKINGISISYKWSSDSFSFSPNTGYQVSHNFKPGIYPFKMTMTTPGCSRSFNDTALVDTFMSVYLPPDTTVCKNSTVSIHARVVDVNGPYSLEWGSGKHTFSGDTANTKVVTVTKDTTIWVRAHYKNFNCPYDEIKIKVHTKKFNLPDDTFICNFNEVITPHFTTNSNLYSTFKWYHGTSPNIVDYDANLNVFDTGLYTCVATDTFGCSFNDSVRVHLNPSVIASANDTLICSGYQVKIDADIIPGHNYTYEWWQGKNLVSSSLSMSVHPKNTTQYSLVATEMLHGVSCSDTHQVTIYTKPQVIFTFEKFAPACSKGDPLQLDSFVKVNGKRTTDGYWTCVDDPTLVGGNYFFPDLANINMNPGYRLSYSYDDPKTGCIRTDTVFLKVYPKPAKTYINVYGDTSFCFGGSVLLASADTATHYRWSSGDTMMQVTIKTSGNYKVSVSNIYGCYSDPSVPVKVTAYPLPPTPEISLTPADSFLECNLANGDYEWFYAPDTFSIPKAISNNTKNIDPKAFCKKCYFSVVFTDTNGCVSDTSAWYYFAVNSIDLNNHLSGFKFYPNPTHSVLFIENPLHEPANLLIKDIFGRTLIEKKIIPGKSTLPLQSFKPGLYFIFMDEINAGKVFIE